MVSYHTVLWITSTYHGMYCISSSSSAQQAWMGLGLLSWGFITIFFLWGGVVSLMPNPKPGGPGYSFQFGSSPLTCLTWEAPPIAYPTISIAIRITWSHRPHHYFKMYSIYVKKYSIILILKIVLDLSQHFKELHGFCVITFTAW